MARKSNSAHKRSMSTCPPDDEAYHMGLEGLRTYERHDINRDGPYYPCNISVEPLTLYRSGGYHPVHLGEIMQEGRYVIVHKLGWGLDGTIWLARDRKFSRDVAIKFLVSDLDEEVGEASVLRRFLTNTMLPRSPNQRAVTASYIAKFLQFSMLGPLEGKKALIIIQAQKDSFLVVKSRDFILRLKKLIRIDTDIIWVCLCLGSDPGTKLYREGSEGVRICGTLSDMVDEAKDLIATSSQPSAFITTYLLEALRKKMITDAYLCDCLTIVSVFSTGADAVMHGIRFRP